MFRPIGANHCCCWKCSLEVPNVSYILMAAFLLSAITFSERSKNNISVKVLIPDIISMSSKQEDLFTNVNQNKKIYLL